MKVNGGFNIDSQRWEIYFSKEDRAFKISVPTLYTTSSEFDVFLSNLEKGLNDL